MNIRELSILSSQPLSGQPSDIELMPLTDSRALSSPGNTLFFALTTSSNDGHRYVRELYRRGVRNFVISRSMADDIAMPDDATWIVAETCTVLEVLQFAAASRRAIAKCPVVAITGSRGKTIVKEMLAEACNDRLTVTSPRSWNSQIGVPLSVWRLDSDSELGVFEAGISQVGEMSRLEHIIKPTIGIFTDLTEEHSLGFTDLSEKCREKAQLFAGCTDIVYNSSLPVIAATLKEECPQARLHPATNYNDIVNVACYLLGVTPPSTDDLPIVSTRIDISEGSEGNVIAFDRYSNDLGGIETALDYISRRISASKPLVVVLGDLQLRGLHPDVAYSQLEQLLLNRGVDTLVAVGDEISRHASRFNSMLRSVSVVNATEFITKYNTFSFPRATILIKGNPRAGFETIKKHLEDSRHDTSLEVNLDALIHNFNYYRSLVKPSTGMIAMVKADAYGAGAVEVSRTLQSQGADYLAVAVVEEGVTLRRAGITMPIMVLNPITSNYSALFANRLEPTIFSLAELEQLSRFASSENTVPYPVHLKLDTGMHRFGFGEDEIPALIEQLKQYPCFKIASVFSHLATADCLDMDDYTQQQFAKFDAMSTQIASSLDYPIKRHILNTAGIERFPEWQCDMVRLGLGLYGISPVEDRSESNLRPVSSLVTTISAIQSRLAGETVGYGRRGVVEHDDTIVATLPIGYADGLNRHLGNGHTSMWVNGHACPTMGNICMDICMIDVTGADARVGDKVEIFGNNIPVTTLANTLNTIPYEVLTSISPRVKRVYYRE